MNIQKNQEKTDEGLKKAKASLLAFRENLCNFFPNRADALIDLTDATASNTTARSVVEVLIPFFRREYNSIFDAIKNFFAIQAGKKVQEKRLQEQEILRLIVPYLPAPEWRKYRLFCTNLTYLPR